MNRSRSWTSKSIGTRFGHRFFYLMIKIGGRRTAYFFLYFIVFYYVVFYPGVKQKTDPYLVRRFPDSGLLKRISERYLFVLHLGKALIDRAILGICGEDAIHISFKTSNDLKRIQELDSGFIILMSHIGCWQVVMSALSVLDRPVNLLMLRDEGDIDKHYFEHGDGSMPFNIISPELFLGGTIEMLNALKNDEVLCIMGDRVFKRGELAVDVDFLGNRAGFPVSAYKIASIAKKPVVVLHSQKTGTDQYSLSIPDVMHIPEKLGKKPTAYLPYAQRFAASLETYTKTYPYQFFNFYDMWNDEAAKKNYHLKKETETWPVKG